LWGVAACVRQEVLLMENTAYPQYDRDSIHDLKSFILRITEKNPDGDAFRYTENDKDITVTYKQFKADIEAIGTALYSFNLHGGKHIAILGENSYCWIVTAFAIMNGLNVIVPIDKDLPSDLILSLIKKADCDALVYSDTYHDVVEDIMDEVCGLVLINMGRSYRGISSFDELMVSGRMSTENGETSFIDIEPDGQSLAAIFFTSGTTGISKGVMLSHRNIALNAIDGGSFFSHRCTSILLLPLHHTVGFSIGLAAIISLQGCVCINRSLKYISADIKKYQPKYLILVPIFVIALYDKVWDTAEKSGKAKTLRRMISFSNFLLTIGIDLRQKMFSSVQDAFGGNLSMIICGGAFIDNKYVKGLRDLGIFVSNGYGITECSPGVCFNRIDNFQDGSVGWPIASCAVKTDAADGFADGEILIRGDCIMQGYYNDEQATAEVFKDEWFKTGDLGHIDSNGYVYLTGRKKNLIVLANGENICPEELENGIQRISFVKEVVVREDVSEKGNVLELVAEIFPDYAAVESMNVDNLQVHFNEAIAELNKTVPYFKRIHNVVIREQEFDKTTTKKIKRNAVY
jgi:long-chain acyl-CoA synthetase